MNVTLPKRNKIISFESLLILIEQLSDEQKQIILEKLRRSELKTIQADFRKLVQPIVSPELSEEDIVAEIKAFRSGH